MASSPAGADKDGEKSLRGEPNPQQWQRHIEHGAFFEQHWADKERYYRFANRDYLTRAVEAGFVGKIEPIIPQLYIEDAGRADVVHPLQGSVVSFSGYWPSCTKEQRQHGGRASPATPVMQRWVAPVSLSTRKSA